MPEEDLWMAPGVSSGAEVVHWVRVANHGLDPLTVHDGQAIGHWENVEERWKWGTMTRGLHT